MASLGGGELYLTSAGMALPSEQPGSPVCSLAGGVLWPPQVLSSCRQPPVGGMQSSCMLPAGWSPLPALGSLLMSVHIFIFPRGKQKSRVCFEWCIDRSVLALVLDWAPLFAVALRAVWPPCKGARVSGCSCREQGEGDSTAVRLYCHLELCSPLSPLHWNVPGAGLQGGSACLKS